MDGSNYGQRVAHLREERGMTRDELAAEIGVPERTLQDIELGKVQKPQKRTRDKIDRALGAVPEGVTAAAWPRDVQVFLDLMGAYLTALPEDRRRSFEEHVMHWIAMNP